MTVLIKIGRRVPRRAFSRVMHNLGGLVSFQTNLWSMISQSMALAKRKATENGKLIFLLEKDNEVEDLHYQLEWIKITIKGTKAQEEEEYNEAMKMYDAFGNIFKKKMEFNEDEIQKSDMKRFFKSKVLNQEQVKDAYEKGYGAVSNQSISAKLNEVGILTYISWEEPKGTDAVPA